MHWGTSERLYVHREGLHQMIHARGGYKTFETNWRLQLALAVYVYDQRGERGELQMDNRSD